jgi:hypothetical protein
VRASQVTADDDPTPWRERDAWAAPRFRKRDRVEWTRDGEVLRGRVNHVGPEAPYLYGVTPDGTMDDLGVCEWQLRLAPEEA